jgi:hypothetical protein
MTKSHVEGLVGEITQDSRESRARQHGAFHSGNASERQLNVLRPATKRRGGCKTCDGRHCVGRCRF